MPATIAANIVPEHAEFMSSKKWLSKEEIVSITRRLIDHGVDELRLTGGEPLLRPNFIEIAKDLSSLSYKKFGVTTNAEHLDRFLPDIRKHTSIQSFNISIDSLTQTTSKPLLRVAI